MSGNEQYFSHSIGKLDLIALGAKHLLPWNSASIAIAPIHADIRKTLEQLPIATYMIHVMVSIENRHQFSTQFV
jgi:hypothetical protein